MGIELHPVQHGVSCGVYAVMTITGASREDAWMSLNRARQDYYFELRGERPVAPLTDPVVDTDVLDVCRAIVERGFKIGFPNPGTPRRRRLSTWARFSRKWPDVAFLVCLACGRWPSSYLYPGLERMTHHILVLRDGLVHDTHTANNGDAPYPVERMYEWAKHSRVSTICQVSR